jgi:predicted nucleic acid-binding protein
MIVVSDTSAITSLLQIRRIEVLARLYGEICIPQAVQNELLQTHRTLPEFVRVRQTESKADVQRLCAELDLGEAEAIVLAKEISADYLLIDETLGRQVAVREWVKVIGLLGVLLEAKDRGYITSVREVTTELETFAGFRVADAVKKIIFREAGEV